MVFKRFTLAVLIIFSIACIVPAAAPTRVYAACDPDLPDDEYIDCLAAEGDDSITEEDFDWETIEDEEEAAAAAAEAGSEEEAATEETTSEASASGSTSSSSGGSTGGVNINTEYSDILSQGIIFANICPDPKVPGQADTCACRARGECTLEDGLQVIVNVSYLILALSGTAALVAFIYGGFEWIISAGYEDRVKRGKAALTGAAIGLAIVFGAYAFINLVVSVLMNGEPPTGKIEDTIGNNSVIQTPQ